MSQKRWQNRFPDLESISDEEISLAILYLDPDLQADRHDATFLVVLLMVGILAVAIVLWFHLAGLRFSLGTLVNSLLNPRSLESACKSSLENCVGR